jgi:hypothetical protein
MKVEVQTHGAAQPVTYYDVVNAYQKGDMYCVIVDGTVYKHPLATIWRVIESYSSARPQGGTA